MKDADGKHRSVTFDVIGDKWYKERTPKLKKLEFQTWLEALPIAPSQKVGMRNTLKQIIDYAIIARTTDLPYNPISLIKLRGTTKRTKSRVILTPAQFKALVLATRPPFDRLVLITGMLGLRIGEAVALQWKTSTRRPTLWR